jgi:site-specific DNA-cytosine methylase
MNVLSLFDGMSCGRIALERAGINVTSYYASEIKKHAIQVTKNNYPDTIHIGDVRNVQAGSLPEIDLLIGGSPCQDFSRGNSNRSGLDGLKSSLFYEWVRLWKEKKPKWFLLENVVMPFEDECIINEVFNMVPIRINSDLVSAQMRDRLYWTNIGGVDLDFFGRGTPRITPPLNKNIKLQDILTSGFTDREKARALLESDSRPLSTPHRMHHRYVETGFTTLIFDSPDFDFNKGVRYMNQTELERCQTVPEGYTSTLKRNEAACLLGDGWTVDVIAHIFGHLTPSQGGGA